MYPKMYLFIFGVYFLGYILRYNLYPKKSVSENVSENVSAANKEHPYMYMYWNFHGSRVEEEGVPKNHHSPTPLNSQPKERSTVPRSNGNNNNVKNLNPPYS